MVGEPLILKPEMSHFGMLLLLFEDSYLIDLVHVLSRKGMRE